MWKAIREKLGAYGAMMSYDSEAGVATAMSYRDTNPLKVIAAMRDAIKSVSEGAIDQGMVDRAIVRVVSERDAPVSPSDQGLECFYDEGLCAGRKQQRRTEILATTTKEVKAAAQALVDAEVVRISIVGEKGAPTLPQGLHVVDLTRSE